MLQAMQAAVVYGMLRAQCPEFVSSDDSALLVTMIQVCSHLSLPTGIAGLLFP